MNPKNFKYLKIILWTIGFNLLLFLSAVPTYLHENGHLATAYLMYSFPNPEEQPKVHMPIWNQVRLLFTSTSFSQFMKRVKDIFQFFQKPWGYTMIPGDQNAVPARLGKYLSENGRRAAIALGGPLSLYIPTLIVLFSGLCSFKYQIMKSIPTSGLSPNSSSFLSRDIVSLIALVTGLMFYVYNCVDPFLSSTHLIDSSDFFNFSYQLSSPSARYFGAILQAICVSWISLPIIGALITEMSMDSYLRSWDRNPNFGSRQYRDLRRQVSNVVQKIPMPLVFHEIPLVELFGMEDE